LGNFINAVVVLQVINNLKRVYATVKDIDLFIGGVTEKPMPGAAVGPTFHYIIGQQFDNLRRTDRFFYDDLTKSVSFNSRKNTFRISKNVG
jgi:peroxidase